MINKNEVLQFIDSLQELEISQIFFSVIKQNNMDAKKAIFLNVISKKLLQVDENGLLIDKSYEYISQIITNLINLRKSKGSILFTPFNSIGYDGAFLIKKNNSFQVFLSETKSSNHKYNISVNNYLNYKINQALSDLSIKCKIDQSSAREKDNDRMAQLFINKTKVYDITEENRLLIVDQLRKLDTYYKIPNAIASTMSKSNPINSATKIKKQDFNHINTSVLLENSNDVFIVGKKLLEKMKEFYEW